MSDRERWIVYPLLFLSLGVSLRSKVAPSAYIEADHIQCKTLAVLQLEEAKSIRCLESLVTPQLGTDKQPVNAALIRNLTAGVVRCDVLMGTQHLFDPLDQFRIIRPRGGRPGANKPDSENPQPETKPAEEQSAPKAP